MLKSETKDFLININRIYPSWKIDDYQATVDIWHRYLEKEEPSVMRKALDEYVIEERNKFAPSVSDLLSLAKKYKPDPRFEGIDYWESRTKSIYPYEWISGVYREWYTTDREAGRFSRYLQDGISKAERGEIKESELEDLRCVLEVYERKKLLMEQIKGE